MLSKITTLAAMNMFSAQAVSPGHMLGGDASAPLNFPMATTTIANDENQRADE